MSRPGALGARIHRAGRQYETRLSKWNGTLFVEVGRLLKLGIAVEVVLYPKLRPRLLQECIDHHSSRACLLWIDLEGRTTIQGALFWVVIEIAGEHNPSGLGQLQIEDLVARRVPRSRFDDDGTISEHIVFIVLEDQRLAVAKS